MLQFVEDERFYEGNPIIHMVTGGFNVDSSVSYKSHPELYEFNVKTFSAFFRIHSTDAAFRPVNTFFSTLSTEIQKEISSTILLMSMIVKREYANPREVSGMFPIMSEMIGNLDKQIALEPLLEDFVLDQIASGEMVLADVSQAGSRPIDRADMTFYQHDLERIQALFVLYKLFCVITGEVFYRHNTMIPQESREIMVSAIYTDITNYRVSALMNKIRHYVRKLMEPKTRNDAAAHYAFSTPQQLAAKTLALICIKKAVAVDLYTLYSNLIKFIASISKSTSESQIKGQISSEHVGTFLDPKDGDPATGNEETNSSRIEIESSNSKKPIIVISQSMFYADWLVKRLISTKAVDANLYNETYTWYRSHPALPNPIAMDLLANYFGPDLGGGKTIFNLNAKTLLPLITCMQVLSLKFNSYALTHILTASISAEEKMGNLDDFSLHNSWKSTPEYSACRKAVALGFGEVQWDLIFKSHLEWLTVKSFIYHTSPTIWNELSKIVPNSYTKTVNDNGSRFDDSIMFMREELAFMMKLWESRRLL